MSLRPLRNRSILAIVQLAVIVFLAGAYMGIVTADEKDVLVDPAIVRAQKFVLVDKKGRERGVWEAGEDNATLLFLDDKGKDWIRITALMKDDGMANVSIGPDDGNHGFVWVTSSPSLASVGVFDRKSQGSTENRPKASLAVWKGTPTLKLQNPAQKPQVKLSADDNGPRLEMYDKKGEVTWSAPHTK